MQNLVRRICVATLIAGAALVSSVATGATYAPVGPFHSSSGTLVLKTPSTFQLAVTCGISVAGEVTAAGAVNVTNTTFSGSNSICSFIHVTNPGWAVTANTYLSSVASNFQFYVTGFGGATSYCGPSSFNVSWSGALQTWTATNQALSGQCTIVSMEMYLPSLTVNP